jgi:1-phosphofructokinase family hexose kinase
MILCVGAAPTVQRSMHFAAFATGEVNRAIEVTQVASGKSVNVARVLKTLGRDVLATGFLGGDSGRFMRAELQREGIAHDFVEVPAPTRTCTTILDRASGQTTELVEEAGAIKPAAWEQLIERMTQALGRAEALVLSGNLSPTSPPDFYARCAAIAAKNGVPVILDSRGPALKLALPHRPALVKPNREELGQTAGRPIRTDDDLLTAAGELLAAGCGSALITLGAPGAILVSGSAAWRLHSPKVQTVNPIGSGDSVAAGFTAALVEGQPPLEAARFAIACGAANAMTALPGVLDPAVARRLAQQVATEAIPG